MESVSIQALIVLAIGFAAGFWCGYLFFKAKREADRKSEGTSVLGSELLNGDCGDYPHFSQTLSERLKSVRSDIPMCDRKHVETIINHFNVDSDVQWKRSMVATMFKAAKAANIGIFWCERKYLNVVRKALKDAGALMLFFIATIAQAVMVALFIALTLPMLGVVRIAPSTATSVKEAVHSLKGYML